MSAKAESEYMAFRPRDLSSKIEIAAKRSRCSKSDVVRKALEVYLDLEPLHPLAMYLGAVGSFKALANAAYHSGYFSRKSYDRLLQAIREITGPVEERLEPLYRQLFPGEVTPREFFDSGTREIQLRNGDLTDEEIEKPGPEPVERWNSVLNAFGHFPDLEAARRVLMRRLGGSSLDDGPLNVDVAPLRKSKKRKGK